MSLLYIFAEEVEGKSTAKMLSSVVSKWVDLDSMNNLGLTSGVKKVRCDRLVSMSTMYLPVCDNLAGGFAMCLFNLSFILELYMGMCCKVVVNPLYLLLKVERRRWHERLNCRQSAR